MTKTTTAASTSCIDGLPLRHIPQGCLRSMQASLSNSVVDGLSLLHFLHVCLRRMQASLSNSVVDVLSLLHSPQVSEIYASLMSLPSTAPPASTPSAWHIVSPTQAPTATPGVHPTTSPTPAVVASSPALPQHPPPSSQPMQGQSTHPPGRPPHSPPSPTPPPPRHTPHSLDRPATLQEATAAAGGQAATAAGIHAGGQATPKLDGRLPSSPPPPAAPSVTPGPAGPVEHASSAAEPTATIPPHGGTPAAPPAAGHTAEARLALFHASAVEAVSLAQRELLDRARRQVVPLPLLLQLLRVAGEGGRERGGSRALVTALLRALESGAAAGGLALEGTLEAIAVVGGVRCVRQLHTSHTSGAACPPCCSNCA